MHSNYIMLIILSFYIACGCLGLSIVALVGMRRSIQHPQVQRVVYRCGIFGLCIIGVHSFLFITGLLFKAMSIYMAVTGLLGFAVYFWNFYEFAHAHVASIENIGKGARRAIAIVIMLPGFIGLYLLYPGLLLIATSIFVSTDWHIIGTSIFLSEVIIIVSLIFVMRSGARKRSLLKN